MAFTTRIESASDCKYEMFTIRCWNFRLCGCQNANSNYNNIKLEDSPINKKTSVFKAI